MARHGTVIATDEGQIGFLPVSGDVIDPGFREVEIQGGEFIRVEGIGLKEADGAILRISGEIGVVFSTSTKVMPGKIRTNIIRQQFLDEQDGGSVIQRNTDTAVDSEKVLPKLKPDEESLGDAFVTSGGSRFGLVIHKDDGTDRNAGAGHAFDESAIAKLGDAIVEIYQEGRLAVVLVRHDNGAGVHINQIQEKAIGRSAGSGKAMTLIFDDAKILFVRMLHEERIAQAQAVFRADSFGVSFGPTATIAQKITGAAGGRGVVVRSTGCEGRDEAIVKLMLQGGLAAEIVRLKITGVEAVVVESIKAVQVWAMLGTEHGRAGHFIAHLSGRIAVGEAKAGI